MAEPEPEPGQRCYEHYAASPGADCAWPLWNTLQWWEREAWWHQEDAERWRANDDGTWAQAVTPAD